jgi:small-conductance mechanosensitive channel
MRRGFRDMNPTLRGFLIIALIAVVIVVLQLQTTLAALFLLARIAFFLAIAYFVYLLWRDRREEISMWSTRSRAVFYGAAALAVANIVLWFATAWPDGGFQTLVFFFVPVGNGWNLIVFLVVFGLAGFAMWRVWRDEHAYGY